MADHAVQRFPLPMVQLPDDPSPDRPEVDFTPRLQDEFTLSIPRGADLLGVYVRGGEAAVYALVDPDANTEERRFYLRETGVRVSDRLEYVGSFVLFGDTQHLFTA